MNQLNAEWAPNQADQEPTENEIIAAIVAKGYSEHRGASCDECDMDLYMVPGTDLDSRFKAFDAESMEWVKINGWLWSFDEVAA